VSFGFDPAALAKQFDLVFDTPGTLPFAAARTLLKPGRTIVPTPAKMIRSALPRPVPSHGGPASPEAEPGRTAIHHLHCRPRRLPASLR